MSGSAGEPRISVIIPVHRDWDRLALCLQALREQTLPREAFEIVVVENDRSARAPAERPADVVYAHQPSGYSYAARNLGIARSRAPLLAFTDADCIPAADWLARGVAALEQADLIGGQIRMVAQRRTVAAGYDLAFGLRQAQFFRDWGGFATANLLLRRQVIDRIGVFDARLESGGDFEFTRRAAAAGLRLAYAEEVVIAHPARETLASLLAQSARTARGVVPSTFRRDGSTLAQNLGRVLRKFLPRPREAWRLLRGEEGAAALAPPERPAVLLLRLVLQWHFATCLLIALWRSARRGEWGHG